MIKTFVKIGVGIEHIATGGKFLTRGHENGRASTTPIRGKPSNMEQTCARNGLIGEGDPSVNQPTCRRVRRSYCRASSSSVSLCPRGSFRKVWLSISARVENRCDDPSCIRRLLSRSLFFWLRDRLRSARDRTLYHQQTLGTSLVAWSYPHRVSCQLSDLIVACGMGVGQQGGKESSNGALS